MQTDSAETEVVVFRAGRDIWLSWLRRSIGLVLAVSVYLWFISNEGVPYRLVRFLGLLAFASVALWMMVAAVRCRCYRLAIYRDGTSYYLSERYFFRRRLPLDSIGSFTLVHQHFFNARYPFIRFNGDFSLEFGEFAGINNLRSIKGMLDQILANEDGGEVIEFPMGVIPK